LLPSLALIFHLIEIADEEASAWLLERKWPTHFSQPQVQLSMPVNVEYKELSVLLEELKQCPEARAL
jgi:hypothetical protein